MTTDEVRKKYLDFFKASPRNHKEISAAPLVVEGDSTTLFTSAGMQPFIPFLMGEKHPEGNKLVNSQPCLRTQDIEEIGDNRHTTFFEMLGNWSLGNYWKEKQLPWIWEFLTKELALPKDHLWVAVFEGNSQVPRDEGSAEIWHKLGVVKEKILYYGVKENWWSRSGPPDKMPEGEIGGPSSEIFFEFPQIKHDPKYGEECHPNCDCGRFLEIGNSVFIQYKKTENGLEELPQKNVDFGGGLERITAAISNNPDVFKIDVYKPLIEKIEQISGKKYKGNEREMRIIADHIRASDALIDEGIVPSNKLHGYVLRRLIRRAAVKMRTLKSSLERTDLNLVEGCEVIEEEVGRFKKTLERGLRQIQKIMDPLEKKATFLPRSGDGGTAVKMAINLYQTYAVPIDITLDELEKRFPVFYKGFGEREEIFEEFEKWRQEHADLSREASVGQFKGGLADQSEEVIKLHTATHLLHAALRKVLGEHVAQKGSNITAERLRFDFTHTAKLTDKEISKIENLVNEQIDKNLPVSSKVMTLKRAKESGALAFFEGRYDEKVKVYSIGDFSKEVCGGPHVRSLSALGGRVRIKKQGSASAGVRRVYATIERVKP